MMQHTKCQKCESENVILVEYPITDPNHYDGWSEVDCQSCGVRFGRWSGKKLQEGESEVRGGD